jgi:chaperonin GroEL
MLLKRGLDKPRRGRRRHPSKLRNAGTHRDDIATWRRSPLKTDTEIGDLIAEVMDKVGKDGVITVEESKGSNSRPNTSRACSSTAATSPYFITEPSAWKRPSKKSPTS